MQRIELKNGSALNRINIHNNAAELEDKLENKIEITGNQAAPVGLYGYYQRDKGTLYFSGFGSRDHEGKAINGRLGTNHGEKTLTEGQLAARGACLNFLNNLATVCDGNLDHVKSIAMRVDINCNPDFKALPEVANGASQLLRDVFGKFIGTPIRTAAGSSSLPNGMMVEITSTVWITKELTIILDIRDAKNLAMILSWATTLVGAKIDSIDTIIAELSNSNKLTKPLLSHLQHNVTAICNQLDKSNIEINTTVWANFANTHKFLEKVESKRDLIDLILYKAKNLNLTLTEEKLSKYSSLYGTANKNKEAYSTKNENEIKSINSTPSFKMRGFKLIAKF